MARLSGVFLCQIVVISQIFSQTQALTKVFAQCPFTFNDNQGSITVTVKSDEKIWDVYGYCQPTSTRMFGEYQFTSVDSVTKTLQAFFSTNDPDQCLLMNSTDAHFLYVEIYLPYGDLPYTVVCNYTRDLPIAGGEKPGILGRPALVTTGAVIDIVDVRETVSNENYIHIPQGGPALSAVKVFLVDILNEPVEDREWRFGRYLKLAAELIEPRGNEISFQLHTCIAIAAGSDQKQFILKNGCGAGTVIPTNQGFTTTGTIAYSFPFKGFHLEDSFKTIFMCSFLMCSENCDGPSCEMTSVHPGNPQKRDLVIVRNNDSPETPESAASQQMWPEIPDKSTSQKSGESTHNPHTKEFHEVLGIAKTEAYIGLAFFLSLISIMTTLVFIVWRCTDAQQYR